MPHLLMVAQDTHLCYFHTFYAISTPFDGSSEQCAETTQLAVKKRLVRVLTAYRSDGVLLLHGTTGVAFCFGKQATLFDNL